MARSTSGLSEALLYLEIINRIPFRGTVSTTELFETLQRDGIEIRLRTLQRYLKELSNAENPPIIRSESTRPLRYSRSRQGVETRNIAMTPTTCMFLQLAEQHLKYQLPGNLTVDSDIERLFDDAREILDRHNHSPARQWLDKVAVVPNSLPFSPPDISDTVFCRVSEALYRNTQIDIVYTNSAGNRSRRRLSPLGLVQQGERVYLIGRRATNPQPCQLALHRISSVKVLPHPSQVPDGFSLNAFVKSHPGFNLNFHTEKDDLIDLSFDFTNPGLISTLKETPFPDAGQSITANPDGSWHLKARVIRSRLLLGWLAMWKDYNGITHIRPEELDIFK